MLKKQVKYVDYNGKEQEDTLYFNLSQAEAVRLDLSLEGGLEGYIASLNEELGPKDIMDFFERLLTLTYGEKSEDGKFFIKNEEVQAKFRNSAAYDALFVSMLQNVDEAVDFFNQVVSSAVPNQPVE